jgi:hypothetical protein
MIRLWYHPLISIASILAPANDHNLGLPPRTRKIYRGTDEHADPARRQVHIDK